MMDNVHPLPSKLERLALKIKKALAKCTEIDTDWIEAKLETAEALFEASTEFAGKDKNFFGDWCKTNGFGEDVLNKDDRAAYVKMGTDLPRMREVLSKTTRRSIRLIGLYEWDPPSRSAAKRGAASTKAPARDRRTDAVMEKMTAGEAQTNIADDVGTTPRTVRRISEAERIRLEGYNQALTDIGALADFTKATAKEKLDAAIRAQKKIYEREHDLKFMHAVIEQGKRNVPNLQEAERKAREAELRFRNFFNKQKKIYTAEEYKAILRCLHPDSNPSAEVKSRAFLLFEPRKFALTGEK
jgi:hypothetical protein